MTTTQKIIDIFENEDTRRVFTEMHGHYYALSQLGVEIKTILDVGAAWGHWSYMISQAFPGAQITQVEPDNRAWGVLEQVNARLGITELHKWALGGRDGTLEFHRMPGNDIRSVGNGSLHRELTTYGQMMETVPVAVATMNTLFKDRTFDLIKIDTQGAEWDILYNGENVVTRAQFVQLELSLVPFNEGEHLFADFITFMSDLNFRPCAIPQLHYWQRQLNLFL